MRPEQSGCSGRRASAGPGGEIGKVVLPDTLEQIGRYVFYGCRNLRELAFSDRLGDIGSGAFTGCRSLKRLDVHLTQGKKTCVKEILGDLWQRIDVVFFQWRAEKPVLYFPNIMRRLWRIRPPGSFFTQHHGSGNNYRQCFYDRETDYRKYDSLFPFAKAQGEDAGADGSGVRPSDVSGGSDRGGGKPRMKRGSENSRRRF